MASKKFPSTPIIDIHIHEAFPDEQALVRKVKVRGSGPGKQNWTPPASRKEHAEKENRWAKKLTVAKARLKDMDRMGVDFQVVSMNLPTPAYWADGATGQKVHLFAEIDALLEIPQGYICDMSGVLLDTTWVSP